MSRRPITLARIETGVPNLDAIFGGGLPKGSVTVLSGPPGSGKTILAQQICFHNASSAKKVLYFNTLSEPTAKTLRYMQQFKFFDPEKFEHAIEFLELGSLIHAKRLGDVPGLIMKEIRRAKPSFVVIDSFKVFDDLAASNEDLRKFSYEIAVNMMAWQSTALLLGEYGPSDYMANPLFSIIDGIVLMSQRESSGEQQRMLQVFKMRGTEHSSQPHPFMIKKSGIEVYAPRMTILRDTHSEEPTRCRTGIAKLDPLFGPGIPSGSTLLVAGVAGTGKTLLLLEFIYRGALSGEKGILFSFEETDDRLRSTARSFGWHLDREIERGMVEIVFIPQPDIMVEEHVSMMRRRIETLGATRVAIDSVSVFLHKVRDPQVAREKVFQLASVVQNVRAIGLFATDIPYGSSQVSRFGVEETVVDGIILLTSTEEGPERQRYVEIYKMRNTAHLGGRHNMSIGAGGLEIYPRYSAEATGEPPPPLEISRRLTTGIAQLDQLTGGGLLARSITLVSGGAGTGKTTLGVQFLLEGARKREAGVYVTLEEGPAQVLESASTLGLPLRKAVDGGLVVMQYLSERNIRAGQFASLLGDAIEASGARRLVFDSASQLAAHGEERGESRQLLYHLVTRFKKLGVTTMFMLESKSLYDADSVSDRDLSPIADNLIVLRYAPSPSGLVPHLTIVKTRGSKHDARSHPYHIGRGGIQMGAPPRPARSTAGKRR